MHKGTYPCKSPMGNGAAPGKGSGKAAAVRGNASGQRPPKSSKGAVRPAGGRSR